MVISISPSGRSSKFNDLATLKIEHRHGLLESPNRLINRTDINAKDAIGADIPLTRASKTFIYQDVADEGTLDSVLHKNGYLDEALKRARNFLERINTDESLVLLYPSLTKAASDALNENAYRQYMRFYCSMAKILGLESIVLPYRYELSDMLSVTKRYDLQLIPVLRLKGETRLFERKLASCRRVGHADIPLIGLKFAPYPKADKAYNLVMDNLIKMHEKKQGTLMVDSPRYLVSDDSLEVSGLHYAPFFMADMVAERYRGKGGGGDSEEKQVARLFCSKDLVTSAVHSNLVSKGKFDVDSESRAFPNDTKLQELLVKMANNTLGDDDWIRNRPRHLSRSHENVRTRQEFVNLQKHINADTTKDYLSEKQDMKTVVDSHLQDRHSRGDLSEYFDIS